MLKILPAWAPEIKCGRVGRHGTDHRRRRREEENAPLLSILPIRPGSHERQRQGHRDRKRNRTVPPSAQLPSLGKGRTTQAIGQPTAKSDSTRRLEAPAG